MIRTPIATASARTSKYACRTFSFSENELGKLVRFFQALARQPFPYIPEEVPVLTTKETEMARSLFSSTAAPLEMPRTAIRLTIASPPHPTSYKARGRLKPDWMERWIIDPQAISRAPPCLPVFSSGRTATGFSRSYSVLVPGL